MLARSPPAPRCRRTGGLHEQPDHQRRADVGLQHAWQRIELENRAQHVLQPRPADLGHGRQQIVRAKELTSLDVQGLVRNGSWSATTARWLLSVGVWATAPSLAGEATTTVRPRPCGRVSFPRPSRQERRAPSPSRTLEAQLTARRLLTRRVRINGPTRRQECGARSSRTRFGGVATSSSTRSH